MVIDYQKLNEMAISDEFPLPKQEDILQALEGSQWLCTLDALAGFTQLEVEPKDWEKLAFQTHRGL
jgi:nitrous oxide reductase accessory protein NosL